MDRKFDIMENNENDEDLLVEFNRWMLANKLARSFMYKNLL